MPRVLTPTHRQRSRGANWSEARVRTSRGRIGSASWRSHGHTGQSALGQRARRRGGGSASGQWSPTRETREERSPFGSKGGRAALAACGSVSGKEPGEGSRRKRSGRRHLELSWWICPTNALQATSARAVPPEHRAGFQGRTGARASAAERGTIQRSSAGRPAGLREKRGAGN